MSCKRAFELDLAAFLAEPRDAAWDDFRAHYPRCADCAREVAAWTALHGALDVGHPDEETLLRFASHPVAPDAPDALAPERRAEIERHVARCPSCADELRALARFVPESATTRVRRPTAARPPATPRRWALRRVGRVLWHPALPYAALLALVLLSTLRTQLTASKLPATPEERVSSPRTAQAPAPVAPASRAARQAPAAARPGMETESRLADGMAAARAPEPAPPAAALHDATAPGAGTAAGGVAERPGSLALAGGEANGLRTLTVLLPAPPSGAATYTVRIASGDGRREIRQVLTASPGARRLAVELPAAWLVPGAYDVEVAAQGGGATLRASLDVPPG